MSNTPAVFNFNTKEVRTVTIDDAVWFVCTDVAKALGYTSPKDASSHLDDDEKGSAIVRTLGGDQSLTIINESGLYALVLRSRKPEARKFAKWVTSEVLPAIRKTGGYSVTDVQAHMLRCIKLASAATEQFKEAVFTDLVANHQSDICRRRFLVFFTPDMKPATQQIEIDAYVASPSSFAKIIAEPDSMLSNTELANIAKACNNRLAQRLQSAQERKSV